MNASASTAPPMTGKLNCQLSVMMFLQYAIWGAWLPILYPFLLGHREFSLTQTGYILAGGAAGAIFGPFIAGQIADRYFSTERFLAISHLLGGILVWFLSGVDNYLVFLVLSVLYGLIYAPTISLTNSLSFHHMPDRDRDFGKVRIWGTVGWIVAGIAMGHWLLQMHTPTATDAQPEAVTRLAEQRKLEGPAVAEAKKKISAMTPEQRTATIAEAIEGKDPKNFQTDESKNQALFENVLADGILSAKQFGLWKALDDIAKKNADAGQRKEAINSHMIAVTIAAHQDAGRSDAFKLSAILGIIMAVFCMTLPHTPPATGAKEKVAIFSAMSQIKVQPLITLFLIAVPISIIHQFYFVHASSFLSGIQNQAEAAKSTAAFFNKIFGVGGGGLMTIGQMMELAVLFTIPFIAKSVSRKTLLTVGIIAYGIRMALWAYVGNMFLIIVGVAMHGFCFGCFIFVAYMVVDEETSTDVRASAQNLFNLVIIGIGIIVGSIFATEVAKWAIKYEKMNYEKLFSVPMWIAVGCLVLLALLYPGKKSPKAAEASAEG